MIQYSVIVADGDTPVEVAAYPVLEYISVGVKDAVVELTPDEAEALAHVLTLAVKDYREGGV